jgi:hypothetical protein
MDVNMLYLPISGGVMFVYLVTKSCKTQLDVFWIRLQVAKLINLPLNVILSVDGKIPTADGSKCGQVIDYCNKLDNSILTKCK